MNETKLEIGLVVYSKAGRDFKKKLLIIDIIDNNYVLLVDGALRKIEKPKRKKIKHIELTDIIIYCIQNKIRKREKVTNAEIRKHLDAH